MSYSAGAHQLAQNINHQIIDEDNDDDCLLCLRVSSTVFFVSDIAD
jgi:hypothetical protein